MQHVSCRNYSNSYSILTISAAQDDCICPSFNKTGVSPYGWALNEWDAANRQHAKGAVCRQPMLVCDSWIG